MMPNLNQSPNSDPDNSPDNEGQQQEPIRNMNLSNEDAMRIAADAINSLEAGTSPCMALFEAAKPYLEHCLSADDVEDTFGVHFREHNIEVQDIVEMLDTLEHDIYSAHQAGDMKVAKRLAADYGVCKIELEKQLKKFYDEIADLCDQSSIEDVPLESMLSDDSKTFDSAKKIVGLGIVAYVRGKNAAIEKFNEHTGLELGALDIDNVISEDDYKNSELLEDPDENLDDENMDLELSDAKIIGDYLGRGHHYREIPGLAGKQVKLAPGVILTQEKAAVKNVFTGTHVKEDVLFVTFQHSDSSYVKVPVELDLIAREMLGDTDPSFEDIEAQVEALDESNITDFLQDRIGDRGSAGLFFNKGLTRQLTFDIHSDDFKNIFALADSCISEIKGAAVIGQLRDAEGKRQNDHVLSGLELDRVRPIDPTSKKSEMKYLEQLRDVQFKDLVMNSLSCGDEVRFGGNVTFKRCDLYSANLNGLTPPSKDNREERRACSLHIKRCNLDKADLGGMDLIGIPLRSLRFHHNYNPTTLPTKIGCFKEKMVTKDGHTYPKLTVSKMGVAKVFKGTQWMPSNQTFGKFTNKVIGVSTDPKGVHHWSLGADNPHEVLQALADKDFIEILGSDSKDRGYPFRIPTRIFEKTVNKVAMTVGPGGQSVDFQVRQDGTWRRLDEEDELANIKVDRELEALRKEPLNKREFEKAFFTYRRRGERSLKNLKMHRQLNPQADAAETSNQQAA